MEKRKGQTSGQVRAAARKGKPGTCNKQTQALNTSTK